MKEAWLMTLFLKGDNLVYLLNNINKDSQDTTLQRALPKRL